MWACSKHCGATLGPDQGTDLRAQHVRGALGQFLKTRDTVFRMSEDGHWVELAAKPGVAAAGAYNPAAQQANELARPSSASARCFYVPSQRRAT